MELGEIRTLGEKRGFYWKNQEWSVVELWVSNVGARKRLEGLILFKIDFLRLESAETIHKRTGEGIES